MTPCIDGVGINLKTMMLVVPPPKFGPMQNSQAVYGCTRRTDPNHFTIKHFADVRRLEVTVLSHIIQDVLSYVCNNACDIRPVSKTSATTRLSHYAR